MITEQDITMKPMSYRVMDLTGQRFGRLTVIKYLGSKDKQTCWLCMCDCGKEHITTSNHLRMGQAKSCGCLQTENGTSQLRKFLTKHGGAGESLYPIWKGMRRRCYCENEKTYRWYGAKGISICEEWNDYSAFREWANANGYREGLSIDRINPRGNYEPQNCRWTTPTVQANNRTNNIIVTYNGESKTVAEWATCLGVKYSTIYDRLRRGQTMETIIESIS